MRNGIIDTELRNWIVDAARRFAEPRAVVFWQHLPREQYPCADLSCFSNDQVVAEVARQCTVAPKETLEQAVQDAFGTPQRFARTAPPEQRTVTGPPRP